MPAAQLSRLKDPKVQGNEKPTETLTFREFGGVNVRSPRQSIGDEQFAWLENAMPIGFGNLPTVPAPSGSLQTTPQTQIYSIPTNINGVDYLFAFCADGSAYQILLAAPYTRTTVGVAGTFSTAVSATQYNNSGILIVDASKGYFDWNLTTPNTLTKISNVVASVTVGAAGINYTSQPTANFSGGGGAGASLTVDISVNLATISTGGATYAVGDVLTVAGGALGSAGSGAAAQITVTAVSAGVVTGISLTTLGDYITAPANPAAVTGGHGAGATFTLNFGIGPIKLTSGGASYTSTPVVGLSGGGGSGASLTAVINGSLTGNVIAVYSGRVWIASGRTVNYSDVGSYNSFLGVGGAFTISDPTLHNNITAICSANQFLYIFGDDSIDVLSNVQVSGGITTFTRTNISASIGTNIPTSVFPYYRSVLFANKLGFYSLSGATPQKISRDLDRLVSAIDFTKPIYGGQVSVFNILCAAFLVWFTDTFTPANTNRPILCVFFDNKWWFSSQGTALTAIASVPTQGSPALWVMDGTNLYQAFAQPAGGIASRVQTKLWDGGAPMLDKATVRAGVGVFFAGAGGQVISVTTDNEIESDAVPSIGTLPVVSWINNASVITTWQNNTNQITQWQISTGYLLLMGYAVTGGGKYFGMTVTSANNQLDYQLLAVEHASTRQW